MFDLVFGGGFLNKPNIIGKSSLDLYFLALDEDDSDTRLTRNRHIFTPGFRVFSDPETGHADYELEAAYQFGDIRASSRSEEHTSELQSLMRTSYADFCLKYNTHATTRERLSYK